MWVRQKVCKYINNKSSFLIKSVPTEVAAAVSKNQFNFNGKIICTNINLRTMCVYSKNIPKETISVNQLPYEKKKTNFLSMCVLYVFILLCCNRETVFGYLYLASDCLLANKLFFISQSCFSYLLISIFAANSHLDNDYVFFCVKCIIKNYIIHIILQV